MSRIDEKFIEIKRQKRAALMPYLPLGFPSLDVSAQLIRAVEEAGADLIELGIPFSDPVADGPVIQRATQAALKNGMSVKKALEIVSEARTAGVNIPLVFMGYYNPILQFGIDKFCDASKEAGVDGLIVPDLPLEEAAPLNEACQARNLDLIFLAAPTSTNERLSKLAEATKGFLYLVSITGVTGARDQVTPELAPFVERTRKFTSKPICVGFGIASVESAKQVAQVADGIIVGSALVSRISDVALPVKSAKEFIAELRRALDNSF